MSKNINTKPGYQKTKVGWIPEDWELKKLKHILLSAKLGGNYKNSEEKNSSPLIKMGNIGRGNINLEKIEYIDKGDTIDENDILKKGDILFNTRNTLDLVGKVSIWNNELPRAYYNSNLLRLEFSSEFVASNPFMNYNLNSYSSIKQLRGVATGTTSVAAIYSRDLVNLRVPLPPLPEQQKIAEILSTWDQSINQQQAIIENCKKRNKGLAQQLLTGKKRLPGFNGKWEKKRASKLFANHTDKTHNGELEVLSATQTKGVIPRSANNIDIKFDPKSLKNYKKVEIGDFVISLRSFQGGIEYSNYEGLVSPAYTVLKELVPISKVFYKIYFKTESFINRLNTIIYGIRDGKQISYKDFSTLKIFYPPVEEQTAIADLLNEAEQELKLQEQKLENLKLQKKGLMQKLLTGEIRVNVNNN